MWRNPYDCNPEPGYWTIDLYQHLFSPKEDWERENSHIFKDLEISWNNKLVSKNVKIVLPKLKVRHFHLLRNSFLELNH